MILISAVLVVAALVLLIVGVVISKVMLVYVSIAVSVIAALLLGVGVFVRRRELFGSAPANDWWESGSSTVGQGKATVPPAQQQVAEPVREDRARRPELVGAGAAGAEPPASAGARSGTGEDTGSMPRIAPGTAERVPSDAVVRVIPGRRRYHLSECRQLAGRDSEEITFAEAREEGFTPCTACLPDTALAARAGKAAGTPPSRPSAGTARPGTGTGAATPTTGTGRPSTSAGTGKPGTGKPGTGKPDAAKPGAAAAGSGLGTSVSGAGWKAAGPAKAEGEKTSPAKAGEKAKPEEKAAAGTGEEKSAPAESEKATAGLSEGTSAFATPAAEPEEKAGPVTGEAENGSEAATEDEPAPGKPEGGGASGAGAAPSAPSTSIGWRTPRMPTQAPTGSRLRS